MTGRKLFLPASRLAGRLLDVSANGFVDLTARKLFLRG